MKVKEGETLGKLFNDLDGKKNGVISAEEMKQRMGLRLEELPN
jgi:hypothetical protein